MGFNMDMARAQALTDGGFDIMCGKVHVTNTSLCNTAFLTKAFDRVHCDSIKSDYMNVSAKKAVYVLDDHPVARPEEKPEVVEARKSHAMWFKYVMEDLRYPEYRKRFGAVFYLHHDVICERYHMPDDLYLYAAAGQHSTQAAKELYLENYVDEDHDIVWRDAYVFIAGLFPDSEFRKLGALDNAMTTIKMCQATPNSLLHLFLLQKKNFNLKEDGEVFQ
jgi:hypothetical protein